MAFPEQGFIAAFQSVGATIVDIAGHDDPAVLLRALLDHERFPGASRRKTRTRSSTRTFLIGTTLIAGASKPFSRGAASASKEAPWRYDTIRAPNDTKSDANGPSRGPAWSSKRRASRESSPRESEILAFIRASGRAETACIRARFGCTRQTLHPMLKRLEALGLVEMRRKGPKSVYLAVNRGP